MKVTKTIPQVLTMVAAFLVCWGPYAVLSIIGVLGFHKVNQTVLCNVASFIALLDVRTASEANY